MAMKIRIMASHGRPGRGPVPALVYRAEGYDEGDRYRERTWTCTHTHSSVEEAFNCGSAWLTARDDEESPEPESQSA